VEVIDRKMTAFECKWKDRKVNIPAAFAKAYPDADFFTAHPDNYEQWVGA
jgi:hypothetical protein